MVRGQVLKLVSLPLWFALSRGRLQLELHEQEPLAKRWRHMIKKDAKAAAKDAGHVPLKEKPEATFFAGMLDEFLTTLSTLVPSNGGAGLCWGRRGVFRPPLGRLFGRGPVWNCQS
jgi:intron-binding protein aquarius